MPNTTIKYSCTSRLQCSGSLPADVIICLPQDKVKPVNGVPVSFIEGAVTVVTECPKSFNRVLYTYSLYFDTDQLADGASVEASDIQGVFCQGCLTSWVSDLINIRNAVAVENQRPVYGQKYVVQFGQDVTTTYVKNNIATMEQQPFDGLIIDFMYQDPFYGLVNGSFEHICNSYAIPWTLLGTPVTDLLNTNFVKFTQCFIRGNIATPAQVGAPIVNVFSASASQAYLNNIGMVARLAFQGGLKGILLDAERYNSSSFWYYPNLNHAYTFAEYQDAYFNLGKLAINRIQAEYPGCTIMMPIFYDQLRNGPQDMSLNLYGLFPKFLDGMFSGCEGATTIVSPTELGYCHKLPQDFDYDIFVQTPPNVPFLGADVLQQYNIFHEKSISTWIDCPGTGFNFIDVNLNYNTPAQFKYNVLQILNRVPRYCVVYNQAPRWWNYTVGVNQMPIPYVTALAEVRGEVYPPIQPPFDINNLSGIQFYYNPLTLSLSDNDPVSSFPDSSIAAHNATQSSPSARPIFKQNAVGTGLSMLQFTSASSQFLVIDPAVATAMAGLNKPFTFACVMKAASNNPGARQIFAGMGKAGGPATMGWGISAAQRWIATRVADNSNSDQKNSTTFINTPPTADTLHVFAVRSNGTNIDMWIDNAPILTSVTQNLTGPSSFDTAYMGAIMDSTTGSYFNGLLGSMAFCSSFLAQGDLFALVQFLAEPYNITVA